MNTPNQPTGPYPPAALQGLLATLTLAAFWTASCSTTEPGDDPLAMDEAVAMFEGIRAIEQDSTPRILHASDDSVVVACPIAGRLRVTGRDSESVSGDTLKLETDFTFAPAGCQFSREGLQFTIDGDPGIRDHAVVGITFEDISVKGAVTGIVEWRLDGRSGSCDIDLVKTVETPRPGSDPSATGMLSGMLCDHDVDLEI